MELWVSRIKPKSACMQLANRERVAGQSRRRWNKMQPKVMDHELNKLLSFINYPVCCLPL